MNRTTFRMAALVSLALLTAQTAAAQTTDAQPAAPTTQAAPATPMSAAQYAQQATDLAAQARTKLPRADWNVDRTPWKQAAAAADQAVNAEPNNPDYLLLRATIYTDVGFWKQAERSWDAYLAIKPNDNAARTKAATVQYNIGYAAYVRGDLVSAPLFFQKCSQLQPDNVACVIWNARVALEGGNYNDATRLYQQAAQLAPNDKTVPYFLQVSQNAGKYGPAATTAFSRAYEAIDKGDKAGALKLYQQATAAAPNFIEAWREQGRLGLELGNLPAATAAYTAATQLPGASAADRYNLSVVQEAQGVGLPAVQAFRAAYTKYASGDKAGAETGFIQATQLSPSYAKAWAWAGRVAYENKDYPAAASAYGQAVSLDPNDKSSAYYLKLAQQGK
ncbi:tetratricopeptide repeat protein [Deinococcus rubellus]|uniref:Tetratricopeptide repeat protein n=1 Tax=Deinococcus rubellus TaxID=1889240 RepID=A0ABY5YH15_9DEIO|nr:tetratricopeptide repeat protein [Deinococcus rubellus]UWX64409.1 tetratricopeptide repeat protein [Deinococcus rubellus]